MQADKIIFNFRLEEQLYLSPLQFFGHSFCFQGQFKRAFCFQKRKYFKQYHVSSIWSGWYVSLI